jgi:hypothetical protein
MAHLDKALAHNSKHSGESPVAIRIIKVPHLASSRNMTANAFASLGI